MKKLITLCLLVVAFVIGTQDASAQDIKNIDVYAKAQSQDVRKLLSLDENDTNIIWRAFYVKAKAYAESVDGKDQKNQSVIESKKRIDNMFKKTILMALDNTQYTEFSKWMAKQK